MLITQAAGMMLLTSAPQAYDRRRLRGRNIQKKSIHVPDQLGQRQGRRKESLLLLISYLPGIVEKLAITFEAAIAFLLA